MRKFNCSKSLLMLLMLFPITTLFERYMGSLNKLLFGGCIILLILASVTSRQYRGKSLIFVVWVTLTYCVSLAISPIHAIALNPNMALYYIFLILYYQYFVVQSDSIKNELHTIHEYIYHLVVVYTAILTLTIFLPISYIEMGAGGWGNEKYFASLSNSPNRIGPASLFIMVVLIYLLRFDKRRKWLPILVLPQLYVGIMGGSRTYLVLIASAAFIYLYFWLQPQKIFWHILVPLTILAFFVIINSPMMTKINISLSYLESEDVSEFWRRLTNSRSVLWPQRIEAYQSFGFFNKLFGKGVNYTSDTFGLWSHNDFIEILCSYGIIGLLNYLTIMTLLYKRLLDKNSPFIVKFFIIFIWAFNAVFNFFYCYFNSVLCYPILLLTSHNREMALKEDKHGE